MGSSVVRDQYAYGKGGRSGLRCRRLKLTGARPSFSNVRHGSSGSTNHRFNFYGIASDQCGICIAMCYYSSRSFNV